MQKADSNSSAGTGADREQKVENTSASQHSAKPLVVGLPSLSKMERFEKFSQELRTIVNPLNDLMCKYHIYPIESFISFPVHKGLITPFINYDAFPSSVAAMSNK